MQKISFVFFFLAKAEKSNKITSQSREKNKNIIQPLRFNPRPTRRLFIYYETPRARTKLLFLHIYIFSHDTRPRPRDVLFNVRALWKRARFPGPRDPEKPRIFAEISQGLASVAAE